LHKIAAPQQSNEVMMKNNINTMQVMVFDNLKVLIDSYLRDK